MAKKQHESSLLSFSDKNSLNSRKKIFQMMKEFDGTEEEKERQNRRVGRLGRRELERLGEGLTWQVGQEVEVVEENFWSS